MAQTQTQTQAQPNGGAQATTNLRALLSIPTDKVERPKPLPDGTYFGTIRSYETGESAQKKTPFLRFRVAIEGPGEDVQADEEKMATLADVDWSRKEIPADYYITPGSLYRLADMLDAVQGPQQGRSSDERIEELKGVRVQLTLKVRMNQDGTESTFNEVVSMIGA